MKLTSVGFFITQNSEDTMKIQTQFGTVNVLKNCLLLDSTEYLEFKFGV